MATNQYLAIATGVGANTLTPAEYALLTSLLSNGYQSGLAQSVNMNTTWRQSSVMAAMIGQFIVNIGNLNANDDGNVTALMNSFISSVRAALTANENSWTQAQQGAFLPVQPVASAATLTLNFGASNNFSVGYGTGVTAAIAANFVLGNPTGVTPGQSGIISFYQNGTGGYTFTSRGSLWKGVGGARVNLTAGANGVDELPYEVQANGNIVLFAANNIS